MKEASVEILSAPASGVGVVEKSWTAVFADLVKARLTTLVLLTTLVGFYAGWSGPMNFVAMFNTLAATALVAAGAAAVFSASLLHEALPVTRGRRYVLLTFMHGAEAEARRLAQLKAA